MDTVITNALVIDHAGVFKADIGLKDGRIHAIGKAGNPDTQGGVTIPIGPGTEAIAGEGKILTAGGMDAHIHFICPQQIEEALNSGVTTMLGGGTGPAHGTLATTCTHKMDLAPFVGADLDVMRRDAEKQRGARPFVFTDLRRRKGVGEIVTFLAAQGGVPLPAEAAAAG